MINWIKENAVLNFEQIKKKADNSLNLIDKIQNNQTTKELLDAISNIDTNQIYGFKNEIESKFNNKITNIVIVGIGGSSLGIKAFTDSIYSLEKKCYFMENIDPVSIHNTLSKINLSESLFVFISKSGGTIETVSQVEYIINHLNIAKISIQNQCIAITSDKKSPLLSIAQFYQITVYPWQGDVGGRFSALTISTLLPLALIGFKIENIQDATKELDFYEPLLGAFANIELWNLNYDVTVLMPYSDQLISFAFWFKQLWAESLGKNEFGSMPELSVGTIDQHSMLQMYLGGKKNKLYTLVKIDSTNTEFAKNSDQKLSIDIKYLEELSGTRINFANMLKIACDSTASSLAKANCPVRLITIPCVNEFYIVKMMIHFILETIFVAEIAGINPFGQKNVEESKIALIQNLIKYQKTGH